MNKLETLGAWGEQQAAEFLFHKGYTIHERNVRVQGAEIDIVAHASSEFCPEDKILCFIEVKTRSYGIGLAERAVGHKKMHFLKRAALGYCLLRNINIDSVPIRFEQISVYTQYSDEKPLIKHYIIPVDG